MIEIMSERPAPAPYRVRNAIARIAALCLALQSLLPYAVEPAEGSRALISAAMYTWAAILIVYMGGRVAETVAPEIWRPR